MLVHHKEVIFTSSLIVGVLVGLSTLIAFKFYEKSEKQDIGFIECRIYNGPRYNTNLRGCFGSLTIIKLSDGRIIKTNDLWYEIHNWFKNKPKNELTGEVISDYQEIDKYSNIDEEYIYPSNN
tara:strand:- start:238 stop:606 length:369 start_codon:yes stop_codon:yes gene_type:complete